MSVKRCFKDRKFRMRVRGEKKKAHPGQAYASARKRGGISWRKLEQLKLAAHGNPLFEEEDEDRRSRRIHSLI